MLERFPVRRADFDGRVLITGASGCIGSWAMALLTRAGVPVIAYDLSDDRRRPRLLMTDDELAKITWVRGDIADSKTVADVVTEYRVRSPAGAVLQGRSGRRRPRQRGRHGQRPRNGAPQRPEAGRLRELDCGALVSARGTLAEGIRATYDAFKDLLDRESVQPDLVFG